MFSKYEFTPERDQLLRDIYAGVKSKAELGKRLSAFVTTTGIPRSSAHRRKQMLGLGWCVRKIWSKAEIRYLEENAREIPIRRMAKQLGRSIDSIKMQMSRMDASYRVSRDGYTKQDAAWLLGVSQLTIRAWIASRYLAVYDGLITPFAMRRFLRDHLNKLNLGRCDQMWITGELAEMLRGVKIGRDDLVEELEAA